MKGDGMVHCGVSGGMLGFSVQGSEKSELGTGLNDGFYIMISPTALSKCLLQKLGFQPVAVWSKSRWELRPIGEDSVLELVLAPVICTMLS